MGFLGLFKRKKYAVPNHVMLRVAERRAQAQREANALVRHTMQQVNAERRAAMAHPSTARGLPLDLSERLAALKRPAGGGHAHVQPLSQWRAAKGYK